jgi:hypothetical protein
LAITGPSREIRVLAYILRLRDLSLVPVYQQDHERVKVGSSTTRIL